MKLSFREEDTHLVVICEGELQPDAIVDTLIRIRDKAQQISQNRILVDALKIPNPRLETYRYLAGEAVAQILPAPYKSAILYHEELINKLTENTASNRGADCLVCHSQAQALAWLLNGLAHD